MLVLLPQCQPYSVSTTSQLSSSCHDAIDSNLLQVLSLEPTDLLEQGTVSTGLAGSELGVGQGPSLIGDSFITRTSITGEPPHYDRGPHVHAGTERPGLNMGSDHEPTQTRPSPVAQSPGRG